MVINYNSNYSSKINKDALCNNQWYKFIAEDLSEITIEILERYSIAA